MEQKRITVLGSFVADLAFRVDRLPARGETLLGPSFALGPGGKGSNQAVAAARAGGNVSFVSKVGRDPFGAMARDLYAAEGIDASHVYEASVPTGAAAILIDAASGDNAIIVVPGACFTLSAEEVEAARGLIEQSAVLMAQLELPLEIVVQGIELARSLGVKTVLNPAPAAPLPKSLYPLVDYITPNESETEVLTGVHVGTIEDAERAADVFLALGVGNAIITLGAQGAFVKNATLRAHVPAMNAGAVVETTGAGDGFNGGFAVALTEGLGLVEAVRFGCATAGISVTRAGTAPSMPQRAEIEHLLSATR